MNDLIDHEKAKLNDPEHDDSCSVLIDNRQSTLNISREEKENFRDQHAAQMCHPHEQY